MPQPPWIACLLATTGLALFSLITSSIFWDERTTLRRDRASALILHLETPPAAKATFLCTDVDTPLVFDSFWQRMPTNGGLITDTATNVSTFTVPDRALYTFDLHLYQDDGEIFGVSPVTNTGYFYLRQVKGHVLGRASWMLNTPGDFTRDGSVRLRVTRELEGGTKVQLGGACAGVNVRLQQGSFSIRREALRVGTELAPLPGGTTPSPTPLLTADPTPAPTGAPTGAPTAAPTGAPTGAPTAAPTPLPTSAPEPNEWNTTVQETSVTSINGMSIQINNFVGGGAFDHGANLFVYGNLFALSECGQIVALTRSGSTWSDSSMSITNPLCSTYDRMSSILVVSGDGKRVVPVLDAATGKAIATVSDFGTDQWVFDSSFIDFNPSSVRGVQLNHDGTLMIVATSNHILFYDTTNWFQNPSNGTHAITLLHNHTDVEFQSFDASPDLSIVYYLAFPSGITTRLVRSGNTWPVNGPTTTTLPTYAMWSAAPEAERYVWYLSGSGVFTTIYTGTEWQNSTAPIDVGSSLFGVLISGNGEVMVINEPPAARLRVYRWEAGAWTERATLEGPSPTGQWGDKVFISYDGSRICGVDNSNTVLMIYASGS